LQNISIVLGKIDDIVGTLDSVIDELVSSGVDAARDAAEDFLNVLKDVISAVMRAASQTSSAIADVLQKISDAASSIKNAIVEMANEILTSINLPLPTLTIPSLDLTFMPPGFDLQPLFASVEANQYDGIATKFIKLMTAFASLPAKIVEFIQRGVDIGIKLKQAFQKLLTNINQGIQDMLDVSKIMAGMLKIDIKTISIADLCNSSLELTKQQALKKQIQLTTSVFSNTEVIAVDPHRIRQVLVNLLDNAVKFTPSGGKVDLDVRIVNDLSRELILSHSVANSCWIKFSITDTGIGISPSDRDMLFQPFIQIDSGLNRKYEGSGLGLVIVKQIVELHGGYVDVSSQIDQGSCFTVYLPTKIARLPIL